MSRFSLYMDNGFYILTVCYPSEFAAKTFDQSALDFELRKPQSLILNLHIYF